MLRTFRWVALASALVIPAGVRGNGRFPSADYFIAGPGPTPETLVLRATFGLIVSRDAGRSWGWVCEGAYDRAGTLSDPTVAVGIGGRVTVTLPDGLRVSTPDVCRWEVPAGSPEVSVVDVAQDGRGIHLVAAVGPNGTDDRLLRSQDGGRSWTVGATVPDFFSETVEVAPSDPRRVYLSGFLRGGIAVLYRSDDGGVTVREMTRSFAGGQSAFLSGIDPTNPDVLWVRASLGLGTLLVRSRDGGATFQRVAETRDLMRGFALSDDGATVWYASANPAEGLLRSLRGGPFQRLPTRLNVRCLRYVAGRLFVCTDEATDGFSLGCSTDQGDTIDPVLSLRALQGPVACAGDTSVGGTCPAVWPAQQRRLRDLDAGAPPPGIDHDAGWDVPSGLDSPAPAEASVDAPPDSLHADATPRAHPRDGAAPAHDVDSPAQGVPRDAPADEADTPRAAPQRVAVRGCGCAAAPRVGRRATAGWIMALMALRRRRRARRRSA